MNELLLIGCEERFRYSIVVTYAGTLTDQAWIESLNGHIKLKYPHLLPIEELQTLRAELAVVRFHYDTVRLHPGLGYVTPDDEHEGRGEAIRKAPRSRPRASPHPTACRPPSSTQE